jgi:hypothetical protein
MTTSYAIGNNWVTVADQAAGPQSAQLDTLVITDKSADGTFALTDANTTWRHPAADTGGRTWTIPANSVVPFPVGTKLCGHVEQGAGAISLAITTDTLELAGSAATTGTRTVATGGIFIATKTSATIWMVGGPGVT